MPPEAPEPPSVLDLIGEAAPRFTAAERQVARVVADDPKVVAFGTVAELAELSNTSGPTVLRFAGKLGFAGFVELQAAVQEEIADQLRPATQRIRERSTGDVLAQVLHADLENVRRTIESIDAKDFRDTIELVADRRHRVFVLAGELSGAPARMLAQQLDLLRDGVLLIDAPGPRVSRQLVDLDRGDLLVVLDLRRYERWILDAVARADERGALVIALTDSRLSPLAAQARYTFTIEARGIGPFDSAAGAMAFVHAFVAAVARRLRRSATGRLDEIEASWSGDLVG
ncbi:MAG TPA: MurR/RpiR family transcriptional regulator [Acidimicrobiia bacterium]